LLASSDESAPTIHSALTAQPIGQLHKEPLKPIVEVLPPASRIKQSKSIAQVKMGPPKGATKTKPHPRKKWIPSVKEVAPKKKKL